MNFLLQIMFGGLMAFVQPSDDKGMMVLAPDHGHSPGHRLILTVPTVYQPQLVASQGATPTSAIHGTATIWTLPPGYEMSILTAAGAEIPLGAVPLTKNVTVPGFADDAEILDSRYLVNDLVDSQYLAPIGSPTPVPGLISFRARLRSGGLRAHYTAQRQARTIQLIHGVTKPPKRLISQGMFERQMSGAHVDLRFRKLSNNNDFFVLRFQPIVAGGLGKVFLSLVNDTAPKEFCQAATDDAGRLAHTVGAFSLLDPPIVPVALPAHQHDSPTYDSITKDCECLMEGEGAGGNKPAVCYPISMPSKPVVW